MLELHSRIVRRQGMRPQKLRPQHHAFCPFPCSLRTSGPCAVFPRHRLSHVASQLLSASPRVSLRVAGFSFLSLPHAASAAWILFVSLLRPTSMTAPHPPRFAQPLIKCKISLLPLWQSLRCSGTRAGQGHCMANRETNAFPCCEHASCPRPELRQPME